MFENSRLKIKRANEHIRQLMGALKVYINSNFCNFAIQQDPIGGDRLVIRC